MAKIKVQDSLTVNMPSERGYIAVVENLFLDTTGIYEDFLDADPEERPQFLVDAAVAGGVKFFVTHLIVRNNGTDEMVEITNDTCKIVAEKDKRKKPKFRRSRFTIPLPDRQPQNLNYLQPYAEIIHNLYTQSEAPGLTPPQRAALRDRAHKFMFGMMLMTRCR